MSHLILVSWTCQTLVFDTKPSLESLSDRLSIPAEHLYLTGHTLSLRMAGGKGGFGSLLRSMNPKKQLADNYDSCRDLSGRRLRTVQTEQRLQEWQARQAEEEKYVNEEVKEWEEKRAQMEQAIKGNKNRVDEGYKKKL